MNIIEKSSSLNIILKEKLACFFQLNWKSIVYILVIICFHETRNSRVHRDMFMCQQIEFRRVYVSGTFNTLSKCESVVYTFVVLSLV